MDASISNHEKNFLIDGAQQDLRCDGRGVMDYRPIVLETGILAGSNGSARVGIGATEVLVSVKAELTSVDLGEPITNRFKFFVDISANASPKFAGRGGNEWAEEIAKALYGAFDSDSVMATNMTRLVLAPTHFWTLYVDVLVLQYDGNAVDASSLGVKAALFDTEICNVVVRPADEGKVLIDLPDEASSWRLHISRFPLLIAVNRIGDQCVFDTDLMEELCCTSTLWVGIQSPVCTMEGNTHADQPLITYVKKTKSGTLEVESMDEALGHAQVVGGILDRSLMRKLKAEEKSRKEGKISHFSKAYL